MLPLFEGRPNGAPFNSFHVNSDYPALGGLLEIKGKKYFCMTFLSSDLLCKGRCIKIYGNFSKF